MLKVNAPNPRGNIAELARSAMSENAALNANPAGFASLLRQTQATPAPKPVAPPPPAQAAKPASDADDAAPKAEANEAPTDAEAPEGGDEASRARAIQKSKARAAESGGPSQKGAVRARPLGQPDNAASAEAKTDDAAAADAKAADASGATGATDPKLDPNVMQWLAGLQRNGAAPADGKASDGPADALGAAGKKAKLAADAREGVEQRTELHEKTVSAQGLHDTLGADGRFAAVLAEHHAAGAKDEPGSDIGAVKEAGAAGAAAFAPGATATREAAPPAVVTVATPVASPDFPEALGLQMSVLARDGVQHAELHLNPADMGPVSVQIVMDGTQARVDFGADVAATRHAIEAGLPALASALRDAGFTLAGGGVSEHSRGRGDGRGSGGDAGGSRREARRIDDEGLRRVGAAARRVVTAGGVDLFV